MLLNLVLPRLVCAQRHGIWQPPPQWFLILLTLAPWLLRAFHICLYVRKYTYVSPKYIYKHYAACIQEFNVFVRPWHEVLNVASSFLEGFLKSTRLLCQTIRWSQREQLLVFVTCEAFSAGALSVTTSFVTFAPSQRLKFGAFLSAFNMSLALVAYLLGSRLGRSVFRRRQAQLPRLAELWRRGARGFLLLGLCVTPG